MPCACSHSPVSTGYFSAGRGSARISVHFPKRTMTSSGSEAKKSMPGIMSSISGGMACVAARAARSRLLGAPVHRRRVGEEAVVVPEVHRVVAGRAGPGEVGLVGLDRAAVGLGGVGVAADALVDVRRHVDDVPGRGHQPRQALRRGHRALRTARGLDRVDVVVVRAGVLGVARQHRLQRGDDLLGSWSRLAVQGPELPRVHVHQRLGEEDLHVVVLRVRAGHVAHRGGVGLVRRLLRGRIERLGPLVARGQRGDQRLLDRTGTGGTLAGGLQRVPGRLRAVGQHRHVVVGAEGPGDAPEAGRAAGVELGGAGERARRLVVVEAVGQAQALVEVALRLGRGRPHRAGQGSEVVEPLRPLGEGEHRGGHGRRGWRLRRGGGGGLGWRGRGASSAGDAEDRQEQQQAARSHRGPPG